MIFEPGHPDAPLPDWERFRNGFSPFLIKEVIDRDECCLPGWFVPLARGAAIASDALLRDAGYRPGRGRPRGWREPSADYFIKEIACNSFLMVRECEETNLWTVERLGRARRHVDDDEVLVHVFGSTPIFTRSYQSAMRLAMHCHKKGPPNGLRWIQTTPDDREGAIEMARKRKFYEVFCATGAQLGSLN